MNLNFFGKNRIPMQILVQVVLCLGLIVAVYAIILGNPIRGSADSQRNVISTKTALAMTAGALLGPFPTATVPTATASDLPTVTSTLPSATPTLTRTPTKTPTPIVSPTQRSRESNSGEPIPVVPTSVPPTRQAPTTIPSTKVPPTNPPPPTDPPTEPPAPTDPPVDPPPATQPPIEIPPIEVPPIIRTLFP